MQRSSVTRADAHLGLRLLADFARDARGSFDVRSRPGEGTSVLLEISVA
jgi:nitrate/nitrite-specific signal transduction histidine kinase